VCPMQQRALPDRVPPRTWFARMAPAKLPPPRVRQLRAVAPQTNQFGVPTATVLVTLPQRVDRPLRAARLLSRVQQARYYVTEVAVLLRALSVQQSRIARVIK
jgi:hypothetical protein